MLQAMIIKKVVDIVLKQVLKKYNLSKMKKYVEEPNDADDRIDKQIGFAYNVVVKQEKLKNQKKGRNNGGI